MDDLKIGSEEWKERLKGKSPEEIAEIVGDYYEELYGKDAAFPTKRILGLVFFALILGLVFITFFQLFSRLSR
jgi:hypothetical protein